MIIKRPWLLVVLILLVSVFTAGFVLRAWNGIRLWETLSGLPLAVSPLYLVVTGALWAVLGLRMVWWLWRGDQRAPMALKALTVGYGLYFWVDQILLMNSPLRRTNWPFLALITVILIGIVFAGLSKPNVRAFFIGGSHEQENQP